MFELRAAVRSILLPVASARDEEFVNEVARYLNRLGVKEDQPNWIAVQLRHWKREASPSPEFQKFVKDLLYSANREPATFMFDSTDGPNGQRYLTATRHASAAFFELHAALVKTHLLDHDSARQILSHAGMITRLAIEENMTASEISLLIVAEK